MNSSCIVTSWTTLNYQGQVTTRTSARFISVQGSLQKVEAGSLSSLGCPRAVGIHSRGCPILINGGLVEVVSNGETAMEKEYIA